MKLTIEDIEAIIIEMYEIEEMYKDRELCCEHEDAGDRV